MKNKKVLRIVHTLDPADGGIATSVIENSMNLLEKNVDIEILTSDSKNSSFQGSNKIKIINMGPGIGKFGFSIKLTKWLLKNRYNYDVFIVDGVWTYGSLISRLLLKKKYFVYIHGTLDPYFKNDFLKKIKKQIYWFLVGKKNLIDSKAILLTTGIEKKLLINTYVNTNNITKKVAGYGIFKKKINKKKLLKIFNERYPELKNKRTLLFLGRFHEKKGCDLLIKAYHKVKKELNFNLFLAGSENIYKNKIRLMVKKYKLEEKVFLSKKILDNNLKYGAMIKSSAMILPSHSENFGVSLVESLSVCRPILISNKVNIYREINKYKSGIVFKNNLNGIIKGLISFNNLSDKELKLMSLNAIRCFNENYNLKVNKNKLYNILFKN
jgi:glycosyltransferase involved in cell wall biosynthesis